MSRFKFGKAWIRADERARESETGLIFHAVSFADDFGNRLHSVKVADGEVVSAPNADPVSDFGAFTSWRVGSADGEPYDFSTPVTSGVRLYANFRYRCLAFTAVDKGARVVLKRRGEPYPALLEYSTGKEWKKYELGFLVVLPREGSTVFFRTTEGDGRFSRDFSDCYFFTTDGPSRVDVSGNVMSLVRRDACSDSLWGKPFAFYCLFSGCGSLRHAHCLELPAKKISASCYASMFVGCVSLRTAPALPAPVLSYGCYWAMFAGCVSLRTAPALPAMTLADGCYRSMFEGCGSLTRAPALPAVVLAKNCYTGMFEGCGSLAEAPFLPAQAMADNCYAGMFWGCKSLSIPPSLPAMTLAKACYRSMFRDCASLSSAPLLPAAVLADYCYASMFCGCASLSSAPFLPAENGASHCYAFMFKGCSSLRDVSVGFASWSLASGFTSGWLDGVSPEGIFRCPSALCFAGIMRDGDGDSAPSGWTVRNP